jgi:hypothetical protein
MHYIRNWVAFVMHTITHIPYFQCPWPCESVGFEAVQMQRLGVLMDVPHLASDLIQAHTSPCEGQTN